MYAFQSNFVLCFFIDTTPGGDTECGFEREMTKRQTEALEKTSNAVTFLAVMQFAVITVFLILFLT